MSLPVTDSGSRVLPVVTDVAGTRPAFHRRLQPEAVAPGRQIPELAGGPAAIPWPDLVLEQLLGYLGPADLARAGRVCRRWYQVASRDSLQLGALARSYPVLHRLQLERLNPRLASQWLSLWCGTPCSDPAQKAEREWQREQGQSVPQRLCYRLIRQMLRTPCLRVRQGNLCIRHAAFPSCDTAWSPDGLYLVTRSDTGSGYDPQLSLWRQESTGLHRASVLALPDGWISDGGIAFGADGRRLHVMVQSGQLQTWQRQAAGHWQPRAALPLSHEPVYIVRFSPDARSMAAQVGTGLRLFGQTATGGWQPLCQLTWTRSESPASVTLRYPDVLRFSDDSRHCLFVNGGRAFVLDSHPTGWQAQELRKEPVPCVYEVGGTLSARGDWLVLASDYPGFYRCKSYTMALWQREGQQWHPVLDRHCMGTGLGFPVAFHPDSRQLAVPDRLADNAVCVSVLTRTGRSRWQLAAQLRLGPGIEGPALLSGINTLEYSGQGACLAAVAGAGVQLWRCTTGAWIPLAWIENPEDSGHVLFQFAPDGHHCVLSMGRRGDISVHGPGTSGGYVTKMYLTHGHKIDRLLLAPGGTRLLVSCWPIGSRHRHLTFLHLVPVSPA